MDVSVKLDRVTITGKCVDGRLLLDFAVRNGWRVKTDRDGKIMAVLERYFDNGETENKAVLMPNPYQENSWRVDTSNHLNDYEKKRVVAISSQLAGAHWTRIDIAFDFINGDVEPMKHVITRSRATQAEFRSYDESKLYGLTGRLETIYSGKRASDKMIRVYNKKIEQKKHQYAVESNIKRWERWEVQLRGKKTSEWIESAREMLSFVKLPNLENVDLSVREKAMLNALNTHVIAFADMGSKSTRAKYHRLQKNSVGYDTHYADLAEKELENHVDDIRQELEEFLSGIK